MHPNTKKVVDCPDTIGKRTALKFFEWPRLDKTQEAICAHDLIRLAQLIGLCGANPFVYVGVKPCS